MAKITQITVVAPASVAAGAAVDVSVQSRFTAYLKGTLVGTWQLQLSDDGANWINYGAALTAQGLLEVTAQAQFARWNCTAFTSGTPTSTLQCLYNTTGG